MARPISDKYQRRINAIPGATQVHREESKQALIEGLELATQEQLYNRTPLEVTRDMYNSIGGRIVGKVVQVGYNIGKVKKKAAHARYRVNMKGISPSGGHLLNMQPSLTLKKYSNPKIKQSAVRCARKIMRGG